MPNLPGLAHSVNPDIVLSTGGDHLADISFLYGFSSAFAVYYGLNFFFPHKESLIPEAILGPDGSEFLDDDPSRSAEEDGFRSTEEVSVSLDGDKQFK